MTSKWILFAAVAVFEVVIGPIGATMEAVTIVTNVINVTNVIVDSGVLREGDQDHIHLITRGGGLALLLGLVLGQEVILHATEGITAVATLGIVCQTPH